MFSRTVPENRLGSWNTVAIRPRSAARSSPATSCPNTSMRPLVTGYSPSDRCAMVDFPPPDSPTSATLAPRGMSKDTRSSTGREASAS